MVHFIVFYKNCFYCEYFHESQKIYNLYLFFYYFMGLLNLTIFLPCLSFSQNIFVQRTVKNILLLPQISSDLQKTLKTLNKNLNLISNLSQDNHVYSILNRWKFSSTHNLLIYSCFFFSPSPSLSLTLHLPPFFSITGD